MQNKQIIKVEHLYSVYGENADNLFVSLTDINCSFEEKKIYCVIGNSGSGKSTLVTHFNGLLNTKYGKVTTNVNQMGFLWELDKISVIPVEKNEIKNFSLNSHQEVFYLNTKKISNKLAKILIQSLYKLKIKKIKRVNFLQNQFGLFFLVEFDTEFKLKILNYKTLDFLSTFKESIVIKKPSFVENIKLKKVKKFKQLRKEIGMVFQFPEYQLFKDTIEKDIMFGPVALGVKKDIAKQKAKFYLNKLGLGDEYLPRSPFGLSGGQKRRVAIAGILAIETSTLIFDEPTAGLDPVGEQEMMNIILDAKNNGKTVIVITHTMDHVLEIADEVIVLNDGEILKIGDPYEIFTDAEIINNTSIDVPKVIFTIQELAKNDERFKILFNLKPRTVEELSKYIIEILNNERR